MMAGTDHFGRHTRVHRGTSGGERWRVARRDGWPSEEIDGALRAQASREQRLQAADDVIRNDRDIESLRDAVASLHRRYLELSRTSPP